MVKVKYLFDFYNHGGLIKVDKVKIDITDRKVLAILLENSRLSYRQIAKRINVSAATVMNRIKKLENNNVIINYSGKINHSKLGFDITAIVELKIQKGKYESVYNTLKINPYIISLYSITGPYDILAITKFRSREELNKFIVKMSQNENIEDTHTKYVLNILKDDNAIKVDHPAFT